MKIYLILVVAFTVLITACETPTTFEQSPPPPQEKYTCPSGSLFYQIDTRGDNETWNGSIQNADCDPPEYDCVAIQAPWPPPDGDPLKDVFWACQAGRFPNYYGGSDGKDFLELTSGSEDSLDAEVMDLYVFSDSTDSEGIFVFKETD